MAQRPDEEQRKSPPPILRGEQQRAEEDDKHRSPPTVDVNHATKVIPIGNRLENPDDSVRNVVCGNPMVVDKANSGVVGRVHREKVGVFRHDHEVVVDSVGQNVLDVVEQRGRSRPRRVSQDIRLPGETYRPLCRRFRRAEKTPGRRHSLEILTGQRRSSRVSASSRASSMRSRRRSRARSISRG